MSWIKDVVDPKTRQWEEFPHTSPEDVSEGFRSLGTSTARSV